MAWAWSTQRIVNQFTNCHIKPPQGGFFMYIKRVNTELIFMKVSLKNTKAELFDAVLKNETAREERNALAWLLAFVTTWAILF